MSSSEQITDWFHTQYEDEISPAQTLRNMSSNFLRYIGERRLKLAVHEGTFRKYMCEAVCTMYASARDRTGWCGPNSIMPRPMGWTRYNEAAWQQYLTYMYFGSEFWTDFWTNLGDPAIWEYDLPHWRYHMERFLPHYVLCNPQLLSCGGGSGSGSSGIQYDSYTDR